MQHLFTSATQKLLCFSRCGVLLLGLGAAGPAAWGQSFGPESNYPAGYHPSRAVLGDVNGDGRLDVVSPNTASNAVVQLLGQTGGSLGAVVYYTPGPNTAPADAVLRDINGDGRLDIVTANYQAGTVGVFLGRPTGFAPAVSYSAGTNSGAQSVAVGDVDQNGRLDIITANYTANTIGILLGQAGGGFALSGPVYTNGNYRPQRVQIGDINGDGRPDVVVLYANGSAVGVLLGLGNGSFANPVDYLVGTNTYPSDLVLGDVNGDGHLDIVTGNAIGTVAVLLGQAGGGFAAVSSYPVGTGSNIQGVDIGDINGDGRLDIVTANLQANTVGVLVGQANGFAPAVLFPTNSTTVNVTLGDMNGDGRLDIVTVNLFANTVGVLLNTGTYTPLATARPAAAGISLAPNPAHDAFAVTLPAGATPGPAELLNPLGQVVRRLAPAGPRFVVETAGLAPGIYTLRVGLGAATLARRVVVE